MTVSNNKEEFVLAPDVIEKLVDGTYKIVKTEDGNTVLALKEGTNKIFTLAMKKTVPNTPVFNRPQYNVSVVDAKIGEGNNPFNPLRPPSSDSIMYNPLRLSGSDVESQFNIK